MTVAELIRDLQAMPVQSARVVVQIEVGSEDSGGAVWEDAEIEEVKHAGAFVEITLRGWE